MHVYSWHGECNDVIVGNTLHMVWLWIPASDVCNSIMYMYHVFPVQADSLGVWGAGGWGEEEAVRQGRRGGSQREWWWRITWCLRHLWHVLRRWGKEEGKEGQPHQGHGLPTQGGWRCALFRERSLTIWILSWLATHALPHKPGVVYGKVQFTFISIAYMV